MSVLRRWAAVAGVLVVVAPGALGQVNIGANFQTQKMTDSNPTNVTPPDTTGSVGPNHFMQYNNERFSYFNKDGSSARTAQTESAFWLAAGLTSAQANATNGDPRLQFDPLSGRWFATCFSGGTNNSLFVARSDTANPTGTWKAVTFAATAGGSLGQFADFPTLGIDRNGVYIATNNFNNSFTVSVFSLPKADLLLATPTAANLSRFDALDETVVGYSIQGVTNFNLGQTNSTQAQLLAVSATAFNSLRFTPVSNTAGAGATLGASSSIAVTLASQAPTAGASQPNAANTGISTTKVDASDDRIGSRVYRVGNQTFEVSGITTSSRAALHIVVLNSTTNAVIAQADISEANFDVYQASIAANARGDVVVGYSRSGFVSNGNANNRWPSAYASAGTLSGSTLTLGTPIQLKAGITEYTGTSFEGSGKKRWGDYSATNVDPADVGIFWTTQEFAFATQEWATQASELIPTVAGEKRWASINATTPAGITGPYATAGNWYNGVAPIATDHVLFSRNGNGSAAYTVTMPAGSTSVDRASVRQGSVVWSIPSGATFNLTNLGTGASDASGNVTSAASLAIADYLGTANLTVSGGGTLGSVTTTIAAGLNTEGSANISNGSLTITGAGTTWNNSANAYVGGNATREGGSGALAVTAGAAANVAGTLVAYNRATGLSANTVTVGTGSTLTVSGLTNPGTGTVLPTVSLSSASSLLVISGGSGTTFGGTISGAGAVTKSNAGTFTLTAPNTYTGATTVTGGTLQLSGGADRLPVATTVALANTAGAILDVNGTSQTIAGLSGGGAAGGNILLGTAGVLTVNQAADAAYSGVISGTGGRLNKGGTATLTLSGPNTYTGATAVTGGTLKLAGTGSFAASPTVTLATGTTLDVAAATGGANFDAGTNQFALASGQTLQGRGTTAGGVTARPGSTLRPDTGTGTGTLTVSGTAILQGAPGSGGATLLTVVAGNGTTSPAHSTLATTDLNLVLDSTNKLNFALQIGTSPDQILQYQVNTVVLATATGTVQVNGLPQTGVTIDPTTYNLTAVGLLLDPAYTLSVDGTGQSLLLSFTPVPEPTTVLALGAVGLGLIGAARRRKRGD